MKAIIVTIGQNYTVSLSNGQKGLHPQPIADITAARYAKLLTRNFGYDFVPETSPETQQTIVESPTIELLDAVEDIYDPNIVDIQSGEVIEPEVKQEFPQEQFINPLKQTEKMETPKATPKKRKSRAKAQTTQAQAKVEPAIQAEVIKEPKHSVLARSRGVSARLAEAGIRGAGVVGCTFFYGIADAAKLAGDLWSEGAAAAIKPLGNHPDSTRQEIAASIRLTADKTLAKAYSVPLIAYAAVTKPKAIVDKAVENVNLKTATV